MSEKVVIIRRGESTDQGTFSTLVVDDFSCQILELPWRFNRQQLSCIPAGEYNCVPYYSRKFGCVYIVEGVPNRSYILFHSGTWAGDILKKFITHSQGCILVGAKKGIYKNQRAIFGSRITLHAFKQYLNNQPFKLIIVC